MDWKKTGFSSSMKKEKLVHIYLGRSKMPAYFKIMVE